MSIWNRVLVVLVAVSTAVFVYMAACAVKTQQSWEHKVVELRQKLDQLRKSNQQLVEADRIGQNSFNLDQKNLGIARAKRELHRLLLGRGRVWNNCAAAFNNNPESPKIAVTTDPSIPNGITVNMTMYAVQDDDLRDAKKSHYMGEFRVEQVGDRSKIVLAPAQALDKDDLQRLSDSTGAWSLYEVLPADRHDIFRGLSRDELEQLLPKESLAEYEKDGQPAAASDPEDRVVHGKYVRQLRDYELWFNRYDAHRSEFLDRIEAVERNRRFIDDAHAEAQRQVQLAKKEQGELNAQVEVARREAEYVQGRLAAIEQALAAAQNDVQAMIDKNLSLAKEIAKTQWEAVRRIEEHSGVASSVGTN